MSLPFLTSARGHLRASVTKIYNDSKNYSRYDEIKRKTIKDSLVHLKAQIQSYDNSIQPMLFATEGGEEALGDEMVRCQAYQDHILESLNRLQQLEQPVMQPQATVESVRSVLKAHQAPLPEFHSTEAESFELFVRNFEDSIARYNYADCDKFLLFRQQVKGKAAFLLGALDTNEQTYALAVGSLEKAFASRPLQLSNVLSQLTSMKLSTSSEPFEYMANMNKVKNACENLKITVNEILGYFFFKGMNESFRSQLILIVNNPRPTLEEIMGNFFSANERYELAKSTAKNFKCDYGGSYKTTAKVSSVDTSSDITFKKSISTLLTVQF